jgi:multisubunit Na+/H+ antiporter MnhG subunit
MSETYELVALALTILTSPFTAFMVGRVSRDKEVKVLRDAYKAALLTENAYRRAKEHV